MVFFSFLVD